MSSSTTASYQDRVVELLRLQPLTLQHVSAEHVQSLLQLSEDARGLNTKGRRQTQKNRHNYLKNPNLVLFDEPLAL